MTVRTRFAPSPTGFLHVGGARTALFSWLYAKKHGGQFVLRIEDTDLERSTKESVNAILQGMEWLDLDYDQGPFYQTERFAHYDAAIERLMEDGLAYRCNCSRERLEALREEQMQNKQKPRYDGYCRNRQISADEPHVIRFRNPESGDIVFQDHIRGEVRFSNSELDDLIIRRTDGSPTYNLTVVIDDARCIVGYRAEEIEAAGGRTLALFTSWAAMDHAVDAVRDEVDVPILTQRDLPKPALLRAFADDEATCLFATAGLFQGVDVPGRTLSLVVIDKLPFASPGDPVLQARIDQIRKSGDFAGPIPC
mgnify:CR=1 FL=1